MSVLNMKIRGCNRFIFKVLIEIMKTIHHLEYSRERLLSIRAAQYEENIAITILRAIYTVKQLY